MVPLLKFNNGGPVKEIRLSGWRWKRTNSDRSGQFCIKKNIIGCVKRPKDFLHSPSSLPLPLFDITYKHFFYVIFCVYVPL
jgi:hypothetical protein